MGHNPYGASCGTSIVVSPRLVRSSQNRLGTHGARLSDTASGKSPKRIKSREEVAAMEENKPQITVIQTPPAQPPCHCKECQAKEKAQEDIFEELESVADDFLAMVHARIAKNTLEEAQAKSRSTVEREKYLRDRGDMDS